MSTIFCAAVLALVALGAINRAVRRERIVRNTDWLLRRERSR